MVNNDDNMNNNRVRQGRMGDFLKRASVVALYVSVFWLGRCLAIIMFEKKDSSQSSPGLILQSNQDPDTPEDDKAPVGTSRVHFICALVTSCAAILYYYRETLAQTVRLFREGAAEEARNQGPEAAGNREGTLETEDDGENPPDLIMGNITWQMIFALALVGVVASVYLYTQ